MRLVVANFNVHCGVDGWGRPYDVVAACGALEADVLVVEETWTPEAGVGTAEAVAAAHGYQVHGVALATGRLAGPHPDADGRWMPRIGWRAAHNALYLDSERGLPGRVAHTARYRQAEPGAWGVAVLTRQPAELVRVVDLGRVAWDWSRRAAVIVRVPGAGLTVVGTHMTHLVMGSPAAYRRLSRALAPEVGGGPAVLAGDMNLWGPPLSVLLPGWHRSVRGPTWPAWRPHSQVDHILVNDGTRVLSGEVRPDAGSDHRPVVVRLEVAPPP